MFNYDYEKSNVNVDKLQRDLKIKIYFQKIKGISSDTQKVVVNCDVELTGAEQVDLQETISAHNPIDMEKIIKHKILKAMDFGKDLIASYGAKNVVQGKTTQQIKQISAKLQNIQPLLESGSLNAALSEMDNIVADDLVSQETIDYFKNEIIKFLSEL